MLLALAQSPRRAWQGLVALLQGRRLRSWNLICAAAADSPYYYRRWIADCEPRIVADWMALSSGSPASFPALTVLIASRSGSRQAERAADTLRLRHGSTLDVRCAPDGWLQSDFLRAIAAERVGGWLLPLFDDDNLAPAFFAALPELGNSAEALVYWDEDRVEEGERCDPWLKPDWDPLLFAAQGGLVGSAMLRADAVERVLTDIGDGDPADVLHALCLAVGSIGARHIPMILTSRSGAPKPLQQVALPDPLAWPSVSIIVPTRDMSEYLATCLSGISRLQYRGELETIVVDNGTVDPRALALQDEFAKSGAGSVVSMPGPFNFSALNNAAVRNATGEMLCLLNNDVEPVDGEWLTILVRHAMQAEVGAVGPMLLYPDQTVQHAGVAIGIGGAAGHVQKGMVPDDPRHRWWTAATRRVSAVTAACLVVRRDRFLAAGGFDERQFAVAFNDVDLCLKLDRCGWHNRYVAEARLIHHESKSRGRDDSPEKQRRFAGELEGLQRNWRTEGFRDPWYSPLFSRASERCLLQF